MTSQLSVSVRHTYCSMFALLLKLYPAQQAITMLVANMHMLTMRTYSADSV